MFIKSVSIENYKSFLDRQTLKFEHGFNLLVGANNSGKTSVLEALDLDEGLNEPHRSIRNITQYGEVAIGPSKIEVALSSDFREFKRVYPSDSIWLPTRVEIPTDATARISAFHDSIFKAPAMQLRIEFGGGTNALTIDGPGEVHGRASLSPPGDNVMAANLRFGSGVDPTPLAFGNVGPSTFNGYWQTYRNSIYRFSAQRRPGYESGPGGPQLERDAVNLPFCINHLGATDAHGHRLLCAWINRVFPSVQWIQAPHNNGNFSIQCLPLAPERRRNDLATPLARMGAGIGNVIAMLYVVLTSRHPQLIIIDEPNAFLHPRALRELLQILESEGNQHQYILSAHSAEVMTAVNIQTIALLSLTDSATTVSQVGPKNLLQLREGLADLGIRMTDLHGRDRVLWVEGQTEELVMPELLRQFCPEIAAGTAVLRVEHTGTFTKKGVAPTEVAKLYARLSVASALVPPMVCILLDRETRSVEECRSLQTHSICGLRFLNRAMLENYLLDPAAIAAILSEQGESTTAAQVRTSMCRANGSPTWPENLDEVNGASIFARTFSELSEARHQFSKTRDVPAVVAWLLKHHLGYLAPLRDELRSICGLPDIDPHS